MLKSAAPSTPRKPMLPEYTPRDLPRSKRSIISIVRRFGAPVMEPPGNAAATASSAPQPGLSRPRIVETSWCVVWGGATRQSVWGCVGIVCKSGAAWLGLAKQICNSLGMTHSQQCCTFVCSMYEANSVYRIKRSYVEDSIRSFTVHCTTKVESETY